MKDNLLTIFGVEISSGGIQHILHRVKIYLGKEYQSLLNEIRGSPVRHADETGHRINGVNGWLWEFLTENAVYYTIEETRGKGIPEKVLGEEIFASLTKIVDEPFEIRERQKRHQEFGRRIHEIAQRTYQANDARAVQGRIKHQGTNLLTALLYEAVPLMNNLAERNIRPMVIGRKISGGSRSVNGAETLAVNSSIVQTIKLRNQPIFSTLKAMIVEGATGRN